MMRALGCSPSPEDRRDYIFQAQKRLYLPDFVDYTSEMSPVQDQGDEGTCCGFACDGMKEWQEKKDWGRFIDLSPRFVYEEARRFDVSCDLEEGTDLRSCCRVLRASGICEEIFCPYEAGRPIEPDTRAMLNAGKYRVKEYWRIRRATFCSVLVERGPFVCGVEVTKDWFLKKVEKTGLIPYPPRKGRHGGHAICVVGYDDTRRLFKFKNSWGNAWGDRGYGYLPYEYMDEYCFDAYVTVDRVSNVRRPRCQK